MKNVFLVLVGLVFKIKSIIEFFDPYTELSICLNKTFGHEMCCSFSNSSVHDPSAQRDL